MLGGRTRFFEMLSPFVGDSGPNVQIAKYSIYAQLCAALQLSPPSSTLTDPLPNIGPWPTRNIVALLLTGQGDWSPLRYQEAHHQEGHAHIPAAPLTLASSRGQC